MLGIYGMLPYLVKDQETVLVGPLKYMKRPPEGALVQ